MARKARPKRRLHIPVFDSYYIPPFQDFCELLKLPTGPIEWVKELSRLTGVTPDVGRSTIAKLMTEGVSEQKFELLSDAFGPEALGVDLSPWLYRRVCRYSELRSNYASWCGPIEGNKLAFARDPDPCSALNPMIAFVEERAKPQLRMLPRVYSLRKMANAGHVDKAAASLQALEVEFYRQSTLIPANVIESAASVLALSVPEAEYTQEQKETLSRYCLYLYWDFYLSALGLFEALGKYSYQGEKGLSVMPTAFMCVLDKISLPDPVVRSAYEALLDNWRSIFSQGTNKQSWAAFAKGIPLTPETTDAGTTLEERQKKQLKDWRRGKSYPSEEMLKQFLSRQPSERCYPVDLMVFHGTIARGLDKLIDVSIQGQKQSGISEDLCRTTLREIFSSYPQHYQKIMEFTPYLEWKKEWRSAALPAAV